MEVEKATYSVPMLCRLLRVSRSGYYAWRSRLPLREAALTRCSLREMIHHNSSRATYGSPRVHAELRAIGICSSRKRVARLMRRTKLRGSERRGRRMKTTTFAVVRECAGNRLFKTDCRASCLQLFVNIHSGNCQCRCQTELSIEFTVGSYAW